MAWVFCGGGRAWLLVQSGLIALLASLVGWRWVGLRAGWRCVFGPCLRVARAVGGWRPLLVVLGRACCGLAGEFLLLRGFSVAVSPGPHVCFVLVLVLVSVFLGLCICMLGVFRANRAAECLGARVGRPRAG